MPSTSRAGATASASTASTRRRSPAATTQAATTPTATTPTATTPTAIPATTSGRRRPQQQRSRAKVDAVLDAADALLAEGPIESLSTTLVAERAGVAVGTIYQYFDDLDAILEGLVERHAERFAANLHESLASRTFRRKRDAANAALDALVDYYRAEPAFRALWRGAPRLTGAGFGDAGELLVGTVIDVLVDQGLASRDDEGFLVEAEVQFAVADGLIRLAFRRDPDGDPVVLAHLRRLFDLDVSA